MEPITKDNVLSKLIKAYDIYGFNIEYNKDENCWSITGYFGREDEVIFPISYENIPFKTIEDEFSLYNKGIKSVTIPEGYTSIGKKAFQNCFRLAEIQLPESLISIGELAFSECGFKKIKLPEGLTSIGERAFYKCGLLTEIKLPESLTSIEERTFQDCEMLTEIRLPENLNSIGEYAFFNCARLINIILPKKLISIGEYAFSFCTELAEIKLPESLNSIGMYAFSFCSKLTNIIIDENNPVFLSINGIMFDKNMTTLMWFPDGKKKKYSVPDGIIVIDFGAFYNCKLTGIYFPKSLLFINGKDTFECKKVKGITVSESNPVFCGVDGVLFNKEKNELIKYPANNDNTDYTIPEGIIFIDRYAFCSCKYLVNIVFPESLEFIGDYAFLKCRKLTTITLPMNLQYVGRCVFEDSPNLKTISLSRKTRIAYNAFEGFTGKIIYRD